MGCEYFLLSAFSEMSFIGSSIVVAGLIVVAVWLFSFIITVSIRLLYSCVIVVPDVVSRFAAVEAEVFLLLSFLLLTGNTVYETSI